jgi:hypothetical protein
VVGAFGDGIDAIAAELAQPLGLDAQRLEVLRELGASLNYSAYGQSEADVLVLPSDLYRIVSYYADPFELVAKESIIARLAAERRGDLARAAALEAMRKAEWGDAWLLPDAPWARRVSGTFANRLASTQPQRAHAVLTPRADAAYTVSVRSPRGSATTAVDFCRRFATGGGRAAAAGIDRLEHARLQAFLEAFETTWR